MNIALFPERAFSTWLTIKFAALGVDNHRAEVSQQPPPPVHCGRSTGARRLWTAESLTTAAPVDPRSPCALSSAGVFLANCKPFLLAPFF